MKFEFNAAGFDRNVREQFRKQFQVKLNAAGLSHVTYSLGDNGQHIVEGYRDQEELEKAKKAIMGDIPN